MPPSGKLGPAIAFGQRVRQRRGELGISQMDLAERARLHFTYVSSVERGERNISLMNIVRLGQALQMDPGRLVEGLTPDGARE